MDKFTNNQIVEIVYKEDYINTGYILNKYHLNIDVINDLKSYIYLVLLEYDNYTLNLAYYNGYLVKMIYKIINNSLSKTSPFSKMINTGLPTTMCKTGILYLEVEQDEYDYDLDKEYSDKIDKVNNILNDTHYYYSTLFRLYLEGYSYKQIEDMTGIKYQSVRQAIVKTIDEIKNKI